MEVAVHVSFATGTSHYAAGSCEGSKPPHGQALAELFAEMLMIAEPGDEANCLPDT
jgi:hypothetical protein